MARKVLSFRWQAVRIAFDTIMPFMLRSLPTIQLTLGYFHKNVLTFNSQINLPHFIKYRVHIFQKRQGQLLRGFRTLNG